MHQEVDAVMPATPMQHVSTKKPQPSMEFALLGLG
jgi:hypothetical protein